MDEFNKLLDQYKTLYLQFLSSGDAQYKTGYQNAYEAIEKTLASKQSEVDSEKRDLQHFASSYEQSNADLQDITSGASGIVRDAQELHDEYETSKERYDFWTAYPPPAQANVDVSVGYAILLRIGIFMMLLPILVYVGYLVPDLYGSSFKPHFPSAAPH